MFPHICVWVRSRYTLLMISKIETVVQCFRMSCIMLAGFSNHDNSIYIT